MKIEEKLQKLKQKMSTAEYRIHLMTLKKEAETLENSEDLKIIEKEIENIHNEAINRTEKFFDDLMVFFKELTENVKEGMTEKEKTETEVEKKEQVSKEKNEKDFTAPLSKGETLILSKEYVLNGQTKKHRIEVISSPQKEITFYQLKVKVEAGENKTFDTLLRFKKNNNDNFSEFFASELIKNCDFYLENRMKEKEILTEERFLKFLKEFGYKFTI